MPLLCDMMVKACYRYKLWNIIIIIIIISSSSSRLGLTCSFMCCRLNSGEEEGKVSVSGRLTERKKKWVTSRPQNVTPEYACDCDLVWINPSVGIRVCVWKSVGFAFVCHFSLGAVETKRHFGGCGCFAMQFWNFSEKYDFLSRVGSGSRSAERRCHAASFTSSHTTASLFLGLIVYTLPLTASIFLLMRLHHSPRYFQTFFFYLLSLICANPTSLFHAVFSSLCFCSQSQTQRWSVLSPVQPNCLGLKLVCVPVNHITAAAWTTFNVKRHYVIHPLPNWIYEPSGL